MSKTAAELYPQHGEEGFLGISDYSPILEALGNVVVRVDDDDYQGDSRVLYQDGDRIGYLQFGWGSCSGCDALQACSTIDEVQDLMDSLQNRVKWFEDKTTALDWFRTHDWAGDYSYHQEEQAEFVEKAIKFLSA